MRTIVTYKYKGKTRWIYMSFPKKGSLTAFKKRAAKTGFNITVKTIRC